jgi:hypothetical protein
MQNKQDQFSEENIKQLVVREFRAAMTTQIVPMLESHLKNMLLNLEKPMEEVNIALCEKLSVEEDRNESMLKYYENSLERLLWIHQRMGMLSQQQLKQQIQSQLNAQKEIAMQLMDGPLQEMV